MEAKERPEIPALRRRAVTRKLADELAGFIAWVLATEERTLLFLDTSQNLHALVDEFLSLDPAAEARERVLLEAYLTQRGGQA